MATTNNQPITLDLEAHKQSINVDIESIAPVQGFAANTFDIANSTITAVVNNPTGANKLYRLVIHADVETGTSATARVVSSNTTTFKKLVKFERITKKHSDIIEPVLAKAGIVIDPSLPKKVQLEELAKHFKVADIEIPAGQQIVRIHLSQVLRPNSDNPKKFHFDMYAPLLCFNPISSVRLSTTLVLPLDFQTQASVTDVNFKPLPGQPTPNLIAGGNTPVTVGQQIAYGWLFQNVDPIIYLDYVYN